MTCIAVSSQTTACCKKKRQKKVSSRPGYVLVTYKMSKIGKHTQSSQKYSFLVSPRDMSIHNGRGEGSFETVSIPLSSIGMSTEHLAVFAYAPNCSSSSLILLLMVYSTYCRVCCSKSNNSVPIDRFYC